MLRKKWRRFLLNIPNLPNDSVPIGASAADNVPVREHKGTVSVNLQAKTHNVIGTQLGILDFERAAKITGSRFVLYKGAGALLERALINFMIDVHTATWLHRSFTAISLRMQIRFSGTGNLPKFEEDLFKLSETNYYLIPTAEVPVTNIYRR